MVVCISVALLMVFHVGARADENPQHAHTDTHLQNVEQMLVLMGVPEDVNKVAGEVLKLYSAEIDPGNTNAYAKSVIDAYQKDVNQLVYGVLGWNAMKATYIHSYAKRMNEQDVKDIMSFLRSPAGHKFVFTQDEARLEIQRTTRHLMEADMAEPLKKLATMLRDGMEKATARERANK